MYYKISKSAYFNERVLIPTESNLIVINAVDMLKLDDDYRMNEPSTSNDKNWAFRLTSFKELFNILSDLFYYINKVTYEYRNNN